MRLTEAQRHLLDEPISALGLDLRLINGLEGAGVRTVRDLLESCGRRIDCDRCAQQCDCELVHLYGVRNLGDKSLQQILEALAVHGFVRGGSRPARSSASAKKFRGPRW